MDAWMDGVLVINETELFQNPHLARSDIVTLKSSSPAYILLNVNLWVAHKGSKQLMLQPRPSSSVIWMDGWMDG